MYMRRPSGIAAAKILQTVRACLGQGKRLDDILDRNAAAWAVPLKPPGGEAAVASAGSAADGGNGGGGKRPIARLLSQLLTLDHMQEAWGVWEWLQRHPDPALRPSRSEYLLMMRGLNCRVSPDSAESTLQLFAAAERRWGADAAGYAFHHQARREAACAHGSLGQFREALQQLETIRADLEAGGGGGGAAGGDGTERWSAGRRGWPGLEDEIAHYRALIALSGACDEHDYEAGTERRSGKDEMRT